MLKKGTKASTSLFYGPDLREHKAKQQNLMFSVSAQVVSFFPSPELHTKCSYAWVTCRCGWNSGKSSLRSSAHIPHCLKSGRCFFLSLDGVKRSLG